MCKEKRKTAFTATYWEDGRERDVEMGREFGIRLPDGRWVPQIKTDGEVVERTKWGIRTARNRKKKEGGEAKTAQANADVRNYVYLGTKKDRTINMHMKRRDRRCGKR